MRVRHHLCLSLDEINAMVSYNAALLDLATAEGTSLERRNLEVLAK